MTSECEFDASWSPDADTFPFQSFGSHPESNKGQEICIELEYFFKKPHNMQIKYYIEI
jgi:hypothetical protein